MRILYGLGASILWIIIVCFLWAKGMKMPDQNIQLLTTAIIAAGAMAGGD